PVQRSFRKSPFIHHGSIPMIKTHKLASLALAGSLSLATGSVSAQGLGFSPFVRTDLVTAISNLGVEQGLPAGANLPAGNPLAGVAFENFGLVKPVTDIVLGGDTLKGLSSFYGPLDALLVPVVALTDIGGATGGLPALPGLEGF